MGTQDDKAATVKTLVGPFTVRDTLVVAGALLVMVGSLLPIPWTKSVSVNMWIFPGLPFHLLVSLLLPLGVGAGFAWRRINGRTRVRIGSLSLDQFGSVVALVAAAYFFNAYVATMGSAYLLGFLGGFAMVCGTTLARYLGAFRTDFVPGDDAVINSDVRPVAAVAPKAGAAAAAGAGDADSEGFGASSAPAAERSKPVVPKTPGGAPAGSKAPETSADAPSGAALGAAAAAGAVAGSVGAAAPSASAAVVEPEPEAEAAAESGVRHTDGEPVEVAGHTDVEAEGEAVEAAASAAVREAANEPAHDAAAQPEGGDANIPAEAAGRDSLDAADDAPVAAARVRVPEVHEHSEPDFPEVSLVQQDAEAAAGEPAATGLVPAAPAEPATSAQPLAQPAHQATAALSRDELAAQMKAAAASQQASADEPFGARADEVAQEPESASFWFALNQPRPVYDPRSGAQLTTLQPGTWILCLEDRGQDYLINLDGDRPAVLRDLDNLQFPEK
ncbi:hypothetical protein ACSYDW_12830 [Paeniglutamicibacter sp. R2-26]|uniref:hypothetical protein n=1 Tax=Paeniglutamicibacter sp. R2-26 TaxID=3144417 RepID=UPI003EE55BF6